MPPLMGENFHTSLSGLNSDGNVRYSWAVDSGPSKLGRIARQ